VNASRVRALEQQLLAHMQLYGYTLVDIPIVQPADVFLTRAGDLMIERLFTFEHHDQMLALRPEFTAAAARHYLQQADGEIVRWQFCGATFVDDTTQDRQQHSLGAELIGQAGSAAEAEIVTMAVEGAQVIGVTGWRLVMGNVALQWHLLARFGLDRRIIRWLLSHRDELAQHGKESILKAFEETFALSSDATPDSDETPASTQRMLDVLLDSTQYGTTMGGRTREEIALRMLRKHQRAVARPQIESALDFLADWMQIEGPFEQVFSKIEAWIDTADLNGHMLLNQWRETVQRLIAADIDPARITLKPNLARNWEYYTGLVFVLENKQGQPVAGGGRYDELTRLLGGAQSTPAVGFAYYADTLLADIPQNGNQKPAITISGPQAIAIARLLRQNGIAAVIQSEPSAITTTSSDMTYQHNTYTALPDLINAVKASFA
jgi:ATP phosphoribosyltransferase regulatory subunit HisZ